MGARSFAGGAAASTLSSGIASGDTTFSVASATTWPSSGAFSIVIDRGLAGEEKVLVASRSGNTLTITTRGYDGTSAAAHSSGATVECCATATDFQEANDHIQATIGHGATGAVVGTTNTQTLTNKTLTAPAISAPAVSGAATFTGTQAGMVLDAASTIGGVSGTTLAADRTAWTSYTPTWTTSGTAPAIGNGSITGYYKQIGKTLFLRINLTAGSTTTFGTGSFSFSLPAGLTSVNTIRNYGVVEMAVGGIIYGGTSIVNANSTTVRVNGPATSTSVTLAGVSATIPAAWDATSSLTLELVVEVA